MSEQGVGSGGPEQKPATGDDEAKLTARLDALGEELESRREEVEAQTATVEAPSGRAGQGMALRLATEFVAGILVGGAIGWFFDGWLGTSPWGLIVFLLAGFAAGVLNALRTAGVVAESPARSRLEGKK
ncbi:MAG: AtpZ/AtpI family protein [Bauldia sp.]|nr:AtpZ/AtpI family protein [Bauldia sp.]